MNKIIDLYLTSKGVLNYKFVKAFEKQSKDYITNFKVQRIKQILKSSQKEISYYRNLFWNYDFNPEKFNDLSELNKLPILTKKDVIENYWEINSSFRLKNSIKTQTSGTTGQILTSYTSKQQWIIEQAAIWNQWKKAGYKFRDKICVLRSFEGSKKNFLYMKSWKNWLYCSPYFLNEKNCKIILKYLEKWKVNFLRGYPSSVVLLSRYAQKFDIKLNHLKSIFVASEFLSDADRKEIEKIFKVKIFNHYGQAETTCMFHQLFADDKSLYNLEYYGNSELIATSKKNIYRLIATNLWNNVMPLIRYDTGDLVIKSSHGHNKINFLKIDNISGRKSEYIINSANKKIPATQFYTYFSKIKHLERFQIIQNSKEDLQLNLKFTNNLSPKNETKKIISFFKGIFENKININLGSSFVLKGEGKFTPLIQKVSIK